MWLYVIITLQRHVGLSSQAKQSRWINYIDLSKIYLIRPFLKAKIHYYRQFLPFLLLPLFLPIWHRLVSELMTRRTRSGDIRYRWLFIINSSADISSIFEISIRSVWSIQLSHPCWIYNIIYRYNILYSCKSVITGHDLTIEIINVNSIILPFFFFIIASFG